MGVWLAAMAICLALALATWIALVFRAQRHEPQEMHESFPDREVNGGKFHARAGGWQVMPDPRAPLTPEPPGGPSGPRPGATGHDRPGTAGRPSTG